MTKRLGPRGLARDDLRVWRAVASGVTPLPGRIVPQDDQDDNPPPPDDPPQPPSLAVPASLARPVPQPKAPLPGLSHGTTPGVDKRSAERMKKGQMDIEARLDLHGMTQDGAHGALTAFVTRAYDQGRRCVLVITGKGAQGAGILRAQVPRWLNQPPLRERILGFSHARPQHGGEGALYLLIRRRR